MGVSKFVNNCSVLLLILQVLNLFSNTNAFPATGDSDDIGTLPIIVDVTCYDLNGTPHIELIPHEFNCTRFYHCKLDDEFGAVPVPKYCDNNLIYNFSTCRCDWAGNLENCFDSDNEEHRKKMFQCAQPVVVRGINGLNLENER